MAIIEVAKIQIRRGQEGITGVPQLDPGEFGWAEDTQHLYIGKRISEGASSDTNTRILTENDLTNIFELLGISGSAASTSTYRYKNELTYPQFASTTTSIGTKLDSLGATLHDFVQGTIPLDITNVLKTAIQTLYNNGTYGTSTVVSLQLPAGTFNISETIDLPPHTTLAGQGNDKTTLVLQGTGISMFRTVDAYGNNYSQSMQFGAAKSEYVGLLNMTLAHGYNGTESLVTLDNCFYPYISGVVFQNNNVYSGSLYGNGIAIRSNIGYDDTTAINLGTQIVNCGFVNMYSGITTEGFVETINIEGGSFLLLQNGINFTSSSTSAPISTDITINNNRFSNILGPAVYVNTEVNEINLVSTNNKFYNVGNGGFYSNELVTSAAYPILSINAPSGTSVNDYFHRQDQSLINTGLYYNPLANGNITIVDNKLKSIKIYGDENNQEILRIPLTGNDQLWTVEYNMYNTQMSKKGKLTINISFDGYASVSDYNNYSESVQDASLQLVFSTSSTPSGNYISLTCSSFTAIETTMDYTFTATL